MLLSSPAQPAPPAAPADEHAAAAPVDLLIPFSAARAGTVDATRSGQWLDATLLAAGCSQVIEDHLHRSEGLLDRVAVHLTGSDPDLRRPAAAVAAAATAVRLAHRRRPAVDAHIAARDRLLEVAVELAAAARGEGAVDVSAVDAVLGPGVAWPAALADRPLRLPSCFRSFDQHPADVAALVALFAERWPDRSQPLLVAGIRTSGSYLGPFAVAALRRLGYRCIDLVTLRGGERLDRSQRRSARRARTGRVIVIDDPPVSGSAVRDSIRSLVAAGIDPSRVVLALAVPDAWELAPMLHRYDRVVLPGSAWHVAGQFDPAEIERHAAKLLAARGCQLEGPVIPVADPVGSAPGGAPRTAREHRRAAYAVTVVGPGLHPEPLTLLVQGTGVGLFGRHDQAVADRLGDRVPDVIGVDDGLMYQLVHAPGPATRPPTIDQAIGYLRARHDLLPAGADRSASMRGRKAAWEVAAMVVGGAMGRLDAAARIALLHPLARQILRVEHPSVIDGRISADRWIAGRHGPVKTDFADGAFSNRDLWSYDPVFDVAALADELGPARHVRAAWTAQTGQDIDPSRWLLLRLVHAWDRHRLGGLDQPGYGRVLSGILADHVGDLLLSDLGDHFDLPNDAPWCAIDIDGVLETTTFEAASAPGWAGGLALRALRAHGFRVVPATGRSAPEVRERCQAWGLTVAVAEYGTVALVDGVATDLRTPTQAAAIASARAALTSRAGVEIDPTYGYALRAWSTGPTGRGPLRPLEVASAQAAAEGAGVRLVAVPGDDQTDLVPDGCSKAVALRWLLTDRAPGRNHSPTPLALAAGDGHADAEMLGLAERAVVPAHADASLRALATVPARHAYQAGLAEGVEALIGHRLGSCDRCEPHVAPASAALLTALSMFEAGERGIPRRLARLASQVARSTGRPTVL